MPVSHSIPRLDKVLVVSSDVGEGNAIASALMEAGCGVELSWDGLEALQKLYRWRPNLVVLDALLPRMDGWEICRRIRDLCDVPVLVLTGECRGTEQLDVLLSGADGFLPRPLCISTLLERVCELLKTDWSPSAVWSPREIQLGRFRIDLTADEVDLDGRPVDVSPTEFRLLVALAVAPAGGLTRAELLARVWGPEYVDQDSFLDLSIGNLRLKIEEDPSRPRWLLAEQGGTYRLGVGAASQAATVRD